MLYTGTKFKCLKIGLDEERKGRYTYLTPEDDGPIEDVDHVRDLGVIMSADGTFNAHISEIRKKVKMKSSWALRAFDCRGPKFMKFIWFTYIQPHIDYASPLYFPCKDNTKVLFIENLQRTFLKAIPYYKDLSYWEILQKLQMTRIQCRIERYIAIYTWRILEGLTPDKTI